MRYPPETGRGIPRKEEKHGRTKNSRVMRGAQGCVRVFLLFRQAPCRVVRTVSPQMMLFVCRPFQYTCFAPFVNTAGKQRPALLFTGAWRIMNR